MKYFTATILTKGKKTDVGFYAESKKEAHYLAKIKYTGMVLKISEAAPPLEDHVNFHAVFGLIVFYHPIRIYHI